MPVSINARHLTAIFTPVIIGIAVISWAIQPENIPDFSSYPAGPERKQAFFSYLLPLIEQRNQEIIEIRQQLESWNQERSNIGWWDSYQLEELAIEYRLENFDIDSDADWEILLRRVDIVPVSLALAQAAKESGWGTSRFSSKGNNFYGQWCYQQGCGMVPGEREEGKNHEVAVFDSPAASVKAYIHNLNSHAAYRRLREVRASLRLAGNPVTGIDLATGLGRYSERGNGYVRELRSMIRNNQLTQYDAE